MAAMPPDLDLTKPIRGVDALEALVNHVLTENPKNESTWLEWKAGVDLSRAGGRFNVAKQVLGFGNRHPERAKPHAGGCAYVVLGAEPGQLVGQSPMDPADITAGLRPYIGSDGSHWTPVWVSVQGVEVLVVQVEPPQWGEGMHTLRKGFENFHIGSIFVRHAGRTDPASPEDLRLLEDRLTHGRTDPLEVSVAVVTERVQTLDLGGAAVEAWIDAERNRLLAPLVKEERAQAKPAERRDVPAVGSGIRVSEVMRLHEQLVGQAASAQTILSGALGPQTKPETRSPEEYRDEVAQYLEACRPATAQVARCAFLEAEPLFHLALQNPTDRNLPSVQLRVHFDGAVDSFEEELNIEPLPKSPRLWGPRYIPSPLDLGGVTALRLPNYTVPRPWVDPGYSSENGGSTTIIYKPVDLRPLDTVRMPGVLLVVLEAGPIIEGTWEARSTGFNGVASGRIEVPLSDMALTPLDLFPIKS
jgi:hypothetical protein